MQLQYKNKSRFSTWMNIRHLEQFTPRNDDFDFLVFRINGIEYCEPSEKFYIEFSKAKTWIILTKRGRPYPKNVV